MTRRDFIRMAGFSAVSYSRILGANERVRTGHIGLGGDGLALLTAMEIAGAQPVVCDGDHRRLLDDRKIDAVVIAGPIGLRSAMLMAACHAGKDVYVDSPLALSLQSRRAVVHAVLQSGRVTQSGIWTRSHDRFRETVDFIRSGRIGRVMSVHIDGTPHAGDAVRQMDLVAWCLGGAQVRAAVSVTGRHTAAAVRQTLWEFEGPCAVVRSDELPVRTRSSSISFRGANGSVVVPAGDWMADPSQALAAHCKDFLNAVRTCGRCRADIEIAATSEVAVTLGAMAARSGAALVTVQD